MMEPPPLSGAPPVYFSVHRARVARALSYTGAALLFAMPFLLLLLFVWGGRNSSTVPFAGREINMDLIAAPFVLGSVVCSLAGFLMGVITRKTGGAKAFYVGGATLFVWLLVAGAIDIAVTRQVNHHYKRTAR